jgi:DNA invertase Pin-like site-specific DNA recombinase
MRGYFGYIRVSTTKQGEQGSSLQEQRAAIEAYASRHNLRIIEWFEEQETAASQGRPVFGRMLKEIEAGRAHGVVTHKIDRSARNLKDWAHIGELIDRGVEMHFAHESLDLMSRSGRLSADILAVVASDYIRNLRDEVRKGFYGRLKQGLYPLGAPLGYLDQGGGKPKTIDPVRGPLVVQAFELYGSGLWTLHTLRDELHRRGLRTRRGGMLSVTGLSTILNNSFYCGIIKLRKTGQVFEGVHEPLISVGLFENVADVLQGRTPRRSARRSYRYQRLIRCAACGASLTPERQKGHVYYRCHTRTCIGTSLREERIDEQLGEELVPLRFTEAELRASAEDVAQMLSAVASDLPTRRDALRLQLAALDDRLQRTIDAYVDTLIDKETFIERKEQILRERASLRGYMTELDGGPGILHQKANRLFELLNALQQLPFLASDDLLRQTLADTTSNLTAVGKKLAVHWQDPFSELRKQLTVQLGAPDRGDLRTTALSTFLHTHIEEEARKDRKEKKRKEQERRDRQDTDYGLAA